MRRSTRVAILALVTGWLPGCGRTGVAEFLDDELGDDGSSDDGSDESTTDESGSSESTTEESTTDDSTDTSSDDETTTESTSDTTDTDESTSETTDTDESTDTTDSDTTDTGGGACDPEPGDDPCTTCAKQFCCAELEACGVDEDCTCVLDCYTGGGQLGQCYGQCGAFGNQPFQQLADCAGADCSNEC